MQPPRVGLRRYALVGALEQVLGAAGLRSATAASASASSGLGSCLFNLPAVLGFGSLLAPDGIAVASGAISFDLSVMIAVAVTMLPIFVTGRVARWQGVVLLTWYLGWTTWLVLDATAHHLTEDLGVAMLGFVVPLTAVALVAAALRRRPRGSGDSAPHRLPMEGS